MCEAKVYPESAPQDLEWSCEYYMHGTNGAARITPLGRLYPQIPGSSVTVKCTSKSNPDISATAMYKIKSYVVGDGEPRYEIVPNFDTNSISYDEELSFNCIIRPFGVSDKNFLNLMNYAYAGPAPNTFFPGLAGDAEVIDYAPLNVTDEDSYGFSVKIKGTLSGAVKYGLFDESGGKVNTVSTGFVNYQTNSVSSGVTVSAYIGDRQISGSSTTVMPDNIEAGTTYGEGNDMIYTGQKITVHAIPTPNGTPIRNNGDQRQGVLNYRVQSGGDGVTITNETNNDNELSFDIEAKEATTLRIGIVNVSVWPMYQYGLTIKIAQMISE